MRSEQNSLRSLLSKPGSKTSLFEFFYFSILVFFLFSTLVSRVASALAPGFELSGWLVGLASWLTCFSAELPVLLVPCRAVLGVMATLLLLTLMPKH